MGKLNTIMGTTGELYLDGQMVREIVEFRGNYTSEQKITGVFSTTTKIDSKMATIISEYISSGITPVFTIITGVIGNDTKIVIRNVHFSSLTLAHWLTDNMNTTSTCTYTDWEIIDKTNSFDLNNTTDLGELAREFGKLHYNDSDNHIKYLSKCMDIMSQDEEKTINYIKENYRYDYEHNPLDFRAYFQEFVYEYSHTIASVEFVREMWKFFSGENKDIITSKYIQNLKTPMYVANDYKEAQ
ncbi:MAG: hypothetical protein ATN35_11050 [Epulopiscium sp. Nele67-Bin004]|nr:MAG: hypothetical protein ATN35_11050 [Epulopiscium sp. Nele67-Bin004]